MTSLYGRAPYGKRANDSAPHGHWGVWSLIGSVRGDGETICMTIDAPTDKSVFLAYVRKMLVPALRVGNTAVMDNPRPHKSPQVGDAIRAAGAEPVFLPPYSPDLNSIEKMWSKIKSILRRMEARTSRSLHRAIRKALDCITPRDTTSWVASRGYPFLEPL